MFYQTETKLQGWRALAIFADRTECLIYVGRSTTHIRAGYAEAFAEVLDSGERAQVRGISLQCWQGAADKGHWVSRGVLAVPGAVAKGQETPTGRAVAAPEAAVDYTEAAPPHRPAVLGFSDRAAATRQPGGPTPLVLPFLQPGAVAPDEGLVAVDDDSLTA